MQKIPCTKCGALILPTTAESTGGLCMPCKAGTREQNEAAKQYYARERDLDRTCPFRALWRNLHKRVYTEEGGFESLSPIEQNYWAINVLVGEVYNGGFDQYFYNCSAELYAITLDALKELRAEASLSLLLRAKNMLFGELAVPSDTQERRELLLSLWPEAPESIRDLDRVFWKNADKIEHRLEQYALKHGLVSAQ